MKMKKYTVENLQKGWMLIREELGENAIILSVKEIDGKFEILAASPELEKLINLLIRIKDSNINDSILHEIQEEIHRNYLPVIEKINSVDILTKIETDPLTKRYINVLGNISSGKSTTIAKLAAILKFNRDKKIAVASFDFYKIGGSDEFEHILFDTPGNIKDLSEVEKLLTFITSSSDAENILTIPLTKKENLIDRDIRYFSKFKIHHLILTKLDELENRIPLYFVLSNYDYKISYITNGLNVPKDIVESYQVLNGIFEEKNR